MADVGGQLPRTLCLLPLYRPGASRSLRRHPEARLSLICLLAIWRAGGIVAPLTPELTQPAPDPDGLEYTPKSYKPELPPVLEQWQPGFVFNFGPLQPLLARALSSGGPWPKRNVVEMRPVLEKVHEKRPIYTPKSLNLRSEVDLDDIAVDLPGVFTLTFGELASALHDSAVIDESSAEGALLELLRASQHRDTKEDSQARPNPFWITGDSPFASSWPPRRGAGARTIEWQPVLDHQSGETYYWNQASGETQWELPAGGRSSAPLVEEQLGRLTRALSASMHASRRSRAGGSSRRRTSSMPLRSGAALTMRDSSTPPHGRTSTLDKGLERMPGTYAVGFLPPWASGFGE